MTRLQNGTIDRYRISPGMFIEELIEIHPDAVTFLMRKGIKCLACGEPIWGTLEQAMEEKGFSKTEQTSMILELRTLFEQDPNRNMNGKAQ